MSGDSINIPDEIKLFLRNIRHGVALVKNGFILYANPKILEYTGYSYDEITDINILELTDEDHYEMIIEATENLIRNPTVEKPIEIPIIRKDGEYRYVRVDGSIIDYNGEELIMLSAIDLTDMRDAIRRMKSIQEKYTSVLEHSPNNIYLADMETMNIIETNSTLQHLLGYSEEELLSMKPYDFIEHDMENINNEVKKLHDGEYGFIGNRKYRAKDGRIIDVDVSATVIDYRGRKTISVVSWDVSDIKKIQEDLAQLNEVLQIVSRITRHDIRNKLAIAYGVLGLMKDRRSYNEAYTNEALKAVASAIDITKRMNDLESLSISGNERKELSLREIIEEVLADHPVKYSINGSARAYIDSAFGSVVDNIIGNAINHGEATRIKVDIQKSDERVLIRISDNGKGMDPDIKDTIFEKGFSHGHKKGTGLGLYIANKVIKRYGGNVRLDETSEKGSTFVIELPTIKKVD